MKKQISHSKINFVYIIVIILILLAFLIYRYFIQVPCAQYIFEHSSNTIKNVSKEYPFFEIYLFNQVFYGTGNINIDVKVSCNNKKLIDGIYSYSTSYYFEKRFEPLKLKYTWKYIKSNSHYEDKVQIKDYSDERISKEKGFLILVPLMPGAEECVVDPPIYAGICN